MELPKRTEAMHGLLDAEVGANIGFYSWLVRQHRSVEQVLMFEPDPTNFELIRDTIQNNAILDCVPMNLALANQCGEATFLLDTASGATGSLETTARREDAYSLHHAYRLTDTVRCSTATIDSLIAGGLRAPSLVKIDVEGAEELVLDGAETCLSKENPILIVETSSTAPISKLRSLG